MLYGYHSKCVCGAYTTLFLVPSIIEFKFLFPELVAEQYTIGTMFLLFEGPKPIGEGEILGCYK